MKKRICLAAAMACLCVPLSGCGPEEALAEKPVVYLYPETETAVSVSLALDGELTCAYPAYNDGWHVTAQPDGTLTDGSGQTYSYLYWEGETNADYDFSEGFCIPGVDTAADLPPQDFPAFDRTGFTVVEWGGAEIR